MNKKCLIAAFALTSFGANAAELITNGGFETGDFTGWTTAVWPGSGGSIFVDSDNLSPLNGFINAGPNSGAFFAVSDQTGPGSYALYQAFTVPIGATSVDLSFSYFVNNQAGVLIEGGLDPNAGASQFASVSILGAAALPFDSGVDLWVGEVNTENPDPWSQLTFDISNTVVAGQTYLLRFTQTDNQLFFSLGLDDISITAELEAPVPEVQTYAGLLAVGLMGFETLRRRRSARA